MRLIDADALKENCDIKLGNDTIGRRQYVMFHEIDDAPTIDAVEVVRCRKCEYWKRNPNTKNYGVCRKVSYDDFEVVMERDDFCSYGIRRENGEV